MVFQDFRGNDRGNAFSGFEAVERFDGIEKQCAAGIGWIAEEPDCIGSVSHR